VVLGELGWMGMGVVDIMMVGRLGPEAIGAVGIGRALFMAVAVFGIGMLLGLDTVISQAFGAGRIRDCHAYLMQGILMSVWLTVPLSALLLVSLPVLDLLGVDPTVRELAAPYLRAVTWSLLPLLLYATFRRYLQSMNLVGSVMLALISANLINAAGNWVLIFGHLGAPALGVAGAGFATLISNSYMTIFLLGAILLHARRSGTGPLGSLFRLEPRRMKRLLALGFPVALQLILEVGVFGFATMLAGRLAPTSLAAHQIALIAASVTFMVPLGISSAAAVRVGQGLGSRDLPAAVRAGWTAMLLGGTFMLIAALFFLLTPAPLLRLFTDDPQVISVGISLLAVAALFQVFDGVQVVATGALRGAGDTRNPMLWNLCGHWLLGLPVGYTLCFVVGWGAVGLWLGLSTGLMAIGAGLLWVWGRRIHLLKHSGNPQET
jgi:MATE family multidrug resistance protein